MNKNELPEDVAKLTDDQLKDELSRMADHEDEGMLTPEQESYLAQIHDEVTKRMCVGGPHADYTGPEASR